MDRVLNPETGAPADQELFSVSELFHENTKFHRTPGGWLVGPLAPRRTSAELTFAVQHATKVYRLAERVALPRRQAPLDVSFEAVLRGRRSIRAYSGAAVPASALSRILALSYGVTGEGRLDGDARFGRRATPSAGALYPLELYLVALGVDGLAAGLYHYDTAGHALERLRAGDLRQEVEDGVLHPEVIRPAALVILLTAVFPRVRFKYGERGYRFALLDAGHVAQNVGLVATALGLGSVPLGGFLDDRLNALLDVDGVDEAVVYAVVIGQPAAAETDADRLDVTGEAAGS